MRTLVAVFVLASSARALADEGRVARAFARLDGAQLSAGDAKTAVRELSQALDEARLARSGTVTFAALASDERQAATVRAAARDELVARAGSDAGLAQALLASRDEGSLPPSLAIRLARLHLERALQLSPLAEGAAFANLAQAPQVAPASAEVPLDPELAVQMGAAKSEVSSEAPAESAPQAAPGKAAVLELDRARALAGAVPGGDPLEPGAHEVAGLAALAAGDSAGAEKEFLAIASVPVRRGDEAAGLRRDRAFLQLARLAYESGNDARAAQLYERVGRGAPEWLDALFEASWSHFRRGQDEHALGNLLTLHAPFFQGRFFPESFVLKALVLYENCRYAEARSTLAEFVERYQPVHDGLAATLDRLATPQVSFELLSTGAAQVPAPARAEVARLSQADDLVAARAAVTELTQELDSFDRRPAAFRASSFAARMLPSVRAARLTLIEATGQRLAARLASERGELRELLGQALRLTYEIAGREKELATAPDPALMPAPRGDPPQVEDDEVLWPFQGEYWRDELGSYRVQLGKRCRKPREAPLEAREPAPQPPRAAARP